MSLTQSKPDSFALRIAEEQRRLEAELFRSEPGLARDAILKKLRQLEVAAHADEWLASPGLQAPR